ncbi:hypothetical protein AB0B28_06765 [Glycomyces sp. NPDC046736]|uniref:hypothetical protein n=1 Tax=Glycomyces sp. NPDC046736 TaxID=3155615 RepID=UPI0033C6230F
MTLTAAAISAVVLTAGIYAARLWADPFARCIWCRGDGIRGGTYCRRCSGSGRRVRLGRRIANTIRAEYRRGTK